ncbi:hypothetical protein ABRZ04_04240 [Castellaniella ginsengisoli]|uniref:Uncharacterized protein n=1 Tax=Castellaniella ginsengisoli TaxID=546114 RepID=A0AB39D1V0_9BURK
MKMAKAGNNDINAAGDLLVILNTLADGYFPVLGEPDDDTPAHFDPDDRQHLRHLYDLLAGILDRAPGFQLRIIAGMAYVVMYSKNEIIDPDADTLELHPKHVQNAQDAERWRYIRRKLCLTGNGNGACAMQAINLPAAIPGWPEPGQVAEFCDAAIDAAIADDRAAAKERT